MKTKLFERPTRVRPPKTVDPLEGTRPLRQSRKGPMRRASCKMPVPIPVPPLTDDYMRTGLCEVTEMRTRTGKVFKLLNGCFRQVISIAPQHYWLAGDEPGTGSWEEIDVNIQQTDFGFETHKACYFWRSLDRGVGCTYRSRQGGYAALRLQSLDGASPKRWSPPYPERNLLRYDNIAKDTDFHWQLRNEKVLGWMTLWSDKAPREWVWKIVHRDCGEDGVQFFRSTQGFDSRDRSLEIEVEADTRYIGNGRVETTFTKRWTGRVANRDKKTRDITWTDDPKYPVVIDPDITESVGTGNDDGYDNGSTWNGSSSYPGIGDFISVYNFGSRFQTVAVPNSGDTIDLANWKPNVAGGSGTAPCDIHAYDGDDAPAFSTSNRPSALAKTAAKVDYTFNSASTGVKTIDVTTEIQEVVNRGGWANDNDMSMFALNDAASGYVTVYSYDGYPANVCTLEIDWSVGLTQTQEGFRWRDDDGSESAASWLAAQDTSITRAKQTATRLRILTDASGNPATQQLRLQWRKSGDPDTEWRDVT